MPFDIESEKPLVELAVGHDKEAFTTLYDTYIDTVYKHVFYRTSNQNTAEDITQEVFIRAWKAIPRYQHRGAPFRSWLIAIANNLLADHYKKYKKGFNAFKDVEAECAGYTENTPIQKLFVHEAINRLTDIRKTVILMHFIEGFTCREIGKFLNKSEGAVRVIQHRAIQDLRSLLFPDDAEESEHPGLSYTDNLSR